MKKRMLAVMIAINIMLLAGGLRVLAIALGGVRQTAAEQGRYTVTVTTPRGTVYDCKLNRMTNTVTKTVAVLPPTVKCVTAVTEQLGDSAQSVLGRLRSGKPVLAEVPVGFKCDSAAVFTVDIPQPDDLLAVHTVGYLNGEGGGVTGIERAYDPMLRAEQPLKVTYTVDAAGRPLTGVRPEISGSARMKSGVVLTIDSAVQRIAEAQSDSINKGAVIVMESATGKIRGMASFPDYSPSSVADCLNSADAPLINRALTPYNVGSVFKLCVAAAALRTGADGSEIYGCDGFVMSGKNRFNCNKTDGHGMLDMTGALARSCNCYFIQLGKRVGASALYDTCIRFGFNRAYSLADGLGTPSGTLPKQSDLAVMPSALANLSFGQGELMLTPLHIAVMVAAIDNGGMLVTPSLVEGTTKDGKTVNAVTCPTPHRAIDENIAATLRLMMQKVVEDGTGSAAKPENGIAGGKTATAETGWVIDGKAVTQSWFAGYWNGYTIVVVREDGISGGSDCAPVFKNICDMMSDG